MKINQLNSYNIARNLERTSVLQASNQAKLAAAKQILGAGDDPAGLAISNNMKAQLGGLNMAARNTQDAMSLLKTADGAGQRVSDILNRMNELAVQSSNGILSASDRKMISGEFNQLKEEIDNISGTASFNNINLLDGTLSSLGQMRTAQSSGISVNTYYENSPNVMESSLSQDYTGVSQGAAASFDISFNDYAVNGAADGDVLSVSIGDQTVELDLSAGDYTAEDIASMTAEALGTGGVTIDGNAYAVSASDNTLTFTYDNGGDAANNIAVDPASLAAVTVEASYVPADESASASVSGSYSQSPASVSGGASYSGQPVQINTIRMTGSLKVGDMFSMGGKRFEFVIPGQRTSRPEVSPISILEASGNAQVLEAAQNTLMASMGNTFNITANGNTMQISQKTAGVGDVSVQMTPAQTKSSMVNFNPAKLMAGDQIKLNITDSRGLSRQVSYTHSQGGSMSDIAKALGGTRIGNSINFTGQTVSVDFRAAQNTGSPMQIQSGANATDTRNLNIGALNTTTLGLKDVSIDTPDKARSAMTAVKNALGQVSEQRGSLGAMQNRMESTLNSLNVSIENQTAARSRIADLDVAKGAMQNMMLKIQQEAQTSMLAQSNINAGNILTLLQ